MARQSDTPVAVVIGGANGIGAACSQLMAKRGWRLGILDTDRAAAEVLASELGGHAWRGDVTDLAALEALAAEIEDTLGPVRGLVVSSGAFQDRYAPGDMPIELWHRVMAVNLDGAFHANRVFGTRMAARRRGSIVNIASVTGCAGSPLLAYGPSKAAIINLTASLASCWGRSGVRVNSVSPGATLVPRVLARMKTGGRYARDPGEAMALGRCVEPIEVAEGVEFLLSNRASAITGIDLPIDCGLLTANSWSLYGGVPAAAAVPLTAPAE